MNVEAIAGGTHIRERGNLQYGVLGGWFRGSDGCAVLLTAAHLVTPDSLRRPAQGSATWRRGCPSHAYALERFDDDVCLCALDDDRALARVVSRHRGLDACIAVTVDERLATPRLHGLPYCPAFAAPVIGHEVVLLAPSLRRGRVVATDHAPPHDRTARDLLVEPLDGVSFGEPGDSGALVVDTSTRAIVGLHVGQSRPRDGHADAVPLGWAKAILQVMEAFALAPIRGGSKGW